MAVIGTLPNILLNGTIADATQVMADFNFIVNQVNENAVPFGLPQPGVLLNIQVFPTGGTFTYTPTSGTTKVIVDGIGAGGGGGGAAATGGTQATIGVGGGAGARAVALLTSGFSGATVVVGFQGAGGAQGNNNGTAGGNTTFGGTLLVCPGGTAGPGGAATVPTFVTVTSGASATPSSSQVVLFTGAGEGSKEGVCLSTTVVLASSGGASVFGAGGLGFSGTGGNGQTAFTPGGGGGGGAGLGSQAGFFGGTGAPGRVVIYEYA
jgi:hypothetical protein